MTTRISHFGSGSLPAKAFLFGLMVPALSGLNSAYAVSLGDIEVQSYLNDPLIAQVALTTTPQEGVSADCIRVIPPEESGQDAALAYLSEAKLDITRQGDELSLEITTRKALVEPILSLALQVDCPGTGRFVREYTLLLDPPLPKTLQSAYARAPVRVSPRPKIATRADQARVWRVRRGETLSKIAARLLPGDRRAQWQLVEEIVARNPAVFPDGDPNQLPAGALLQLPQGTNQRVAGNVRSVPNPAAGSARLESGGQGTAAESNSSSHRLTLSTREQTATPEAAAETARMVADTRKLILETEAQYASAEALKSRLQRLEKQIALLEQALTSLDRVTGAPREALQQAASEQEPIVTPPASAPSPGTVVSMVTPPPVKQNTAPITVPTPDPVVVAGAQDQSRTSYWWWVLAFLGIGALILWVRTGRTPVEEGEAAGVRDLNLDELIPEPTGASRASKSAMEGVRPDLSHKEVVFSDDPLAGLPDELEEQDLPLEEAANLSQEVPTLNHELTQQMEQGLMLENFDFQEQQIDTSREVNNILVRSEFHLLLKQTDSAVKLLRESIEQNETLSQEPALWLMLLRIYRQERRSEPFAELRQEFGKIFNIEVPGWEAEDRRSGDERATLEADYPRLMHRIVALWNTPNCMLFVDNLLHDDRDGTRRGFDIHIAEELLMLKGVLRVRKTL